MKSILYYFNPSLKFLTRIAFMVAVLALMGLMGCASLSKNLLERTAKLHKEIKIVSCPPKLNPLKKSLAKNQKLYCLIFTLEQQTAERAPAQMTGIWIASSTSSADIPPMVFIPSGPTTTHFFQTQRELALLKQLVTTLSWKGDFIALTPREHPQNILNLKCETALQAISKSRPSPQTRGHDYKNFFDSCLAELQTPSAKNRFTTSHYSSQQFAEDILAFNQFLNHESINLLATSYGTRAALELLYRIPTRIDRVVFENLYPLNYHPLDDLPWTLENILTRLEQACAKNKTCKLKFNNRLTQYLNTALTRLEKDSLIVESTLSSILDEPTSKEASQESFGYYIDSHGYLNYIISHLYSKEGVAGLPALLASGKDGNYFPQIENLHQSLTTSTQNKQANPLMKSVFYHLWLCNDRQKSTNLSSDPKLLNKLARSNLPDTIKNIIQEEWQASPCNDFIKSPVPRRASRLLKNQATTTPPLLILSAEMHARFSPDLVDPSSLKLPHTSHILFYGETGELLLQNSCAQATVEHFFKAPSKQIYPATLKNEVANQLPCVKELTQKVFPFKTTS